MDVVYEWFEELPDQCPPAQASNREGFICFRLCEGVLPAERDFLSHRTLFPRKVFRATECQARAISVYREAKDLDSVLKLPAHKHKNKVKIILGQDDGAVMKTGKDSHYSWWRSKRFDLLCAAGGMQ
ncbi:hypothetical protein AO067_20310 [Pseudomonas viridiflava ICMP 13104]|uniref:Uncharacterized protein n=1 Tax=Pseudomonas viridiflava ICMP 13104 TaxID=1198305 RepID=A0A0W0H2C6_PSEVI|nr:hypothetical protein AO067_20310 [Pseudomonas viridiflava ICMP 13104]